MNILNLTTHLNIILSLEQYVMMSQSIKRLCQLVIVLFPFNLSEVRCSVLVALIVCGNAWMRDGVETERAVRDRGMCTRAAAYTAHVTPQCRKVHATFQMCFLGALLSDTFIHLFRLL